MYFKLEKIKKILKNKNSRVVLVILFLLVFIITTLIIERGTFLEYKELGESYIQNYKINTLCRYITMAISFVILYILIYFINRGIKKGLKPFLEQDKVQMPKFLNKSIALVVAALGSVIISNILQEKILMLISNVSFGEPFDPVFNLDTSYYMFIKPLIETIIEFYLFIIIGTIFISMLSQVLFSGLVFVSTFKFCCSATSYKEEITVSVYGTVTLNDSPFP